MTWHLKPDDKLIGSVIRLETAITEYVPVFVVQSSAEPRAMATSTTRVGAKP
jgi:hypothetical protein